MDSGIGMKKKRFAAMQAAQKKKAAEQKPGMSLGIADCDIGASPQMSKGAIYSKKFGGGAKSSPLQVAVQFKLGRKK